VASAVAALIGVGVIALVVWALLAPSTVVGGVFVIVPVLALAIWPLLPSERS
jgi:hypothetical protein